MEIQSRSVNGVMVLELAGRLDAYEVPSLKNWLDANPDFANLVINLDGVNFIDSSGLAVLVTGVKRCRQNKGELRLCNVQQNVKVIFELTRLDSVFDTYEDEASAISTFS
ncbi:MAG: STAS domain-containing protein [Anaerolineae bacterium]|nr:STAS domain-containing protein [Anaerolineae bacterium]